MPSKTKNLKCPICNRQVIRPNTWLKYHISYKPELTVYACKWCNYTEFCIRNELRIPFLERNEFSPNRASRAEMVLAFHKKLGYPLSIKK